MGFSLQVSFCDLSNGNTPLRQNIVSAGIAVWNKSFNFAELKDTYMNQQIVYNLEETAGIKETLHDFKAESILVDESFAKQAQRYQLNDVKYKSIYDR